MPVAPATSRDVSRATLDEQKQDTDRENQLRSAAPVATSTRDEQFTLLGKRPAPPDCGAVEASSQPSRFSHTGHPEDGGLFEILPFVDRITGRVSNVRGISHIKRNKFDAYDDNSKYVETLNKWDQSDIGQRGMPPLPKIVLLRDAGLNGGAGSSRNTGRSHRSERSHGSSSAGSTSTSGSRAERLLRSCLTDVRMDHRLSRIVNGRHRAEYAIEWLSSEARDQAIDEFVQSLRVWNPDYEPKTESDGEADDAMALIDPSDPTHRLQRTYDIANVMRNEDPEGAYFVCLKSRGHILGIASIEPSNPPYVGDLLTHPGTSRVGSNLLRVVSETSLSWQCGGIFQLDAGDEAARDRYISMGLQHIGPQFLMRFDPAAG
jgi:hypothetical protein